LHNKKKCAKENKLVHKQKLVRGIYESKQALTVVLTGYGGIVMQSNVKLNKYSFIFVPMRVKDESKIDAIFNATLALVKDRGLAGITMCDISKAACVGTGTLYIYFKNKDELIKALFMECREQSVKHYFKGVDSEGTLEARMRKVFTNIIHYKMMYFEVSAFLEQTYHSPFVCMTDLRKKEKALQPLFSLIKEGIQEGIVKDVDIDLIVSYTFGIINEMVKKAYFTNKKISVETIDQLYAIYWDGIKLAQ
jgi:AcrR family transcriptional regulator